MESVTVEPVLRVCGALWRVIRDEVAAAECSAASRLS
jgi:hypothetical protein